MKKEDEEIYRVDTYRKLGDIWLAIGNKEKAIEMYEEAIRLEPEDENTYEKLKEVFRVHSGSKEEKHEKLFNSIVKSLERD